jgi:hypothetical protein
MGSTGSHREPGTSTADFIAAECLGSEGRYGRFLKTKIVSTGESDWPRVMYVAWELGEAHGDEAGDVIGMVVLHHWGGGYFNFTHKEVTETMGPCEDECPASILDLLSPTTNEFALEWRAPVPCQRRQGGGQAEGPRRRHGALHLADHLRQRRRARHLRVREGQRVPRRSGLRPLPHHELAAQRLHHHREGGRMRLIRRAKVATTTDHSVGIYGS